MNRNRFLGLALATVVAGGTAGAAATPAMADLTGAGSTLVAPLMTNWAQDFQARYNIKVTYGAVGSGAGIAQISARTVDFGASDAPLSAAQAAQCNNCVQIPWGLTATVLAFHLDGVKALKLNGNVVAQIYLGTITQWNDPRIAKLNKGVKLPATQITPVFRSDGSGDTYAFTDWLAHVSPSWKKRVGTATSVSFPKGVGGNKNDGVTAVVASTNGAIGYVSAAYAITHNLGVAALQNRAGNYEYPNLKNIKAAAKVVKKVPANNELHIVDPPKSAKDAYPLSTFTYAIVPKQPKQKDALSRFILYAMGSNGQKFGPALDFQPLPGIVYSAGLKTVQSLG